MTHWDLMSSPYYRGVLNQRSFSTLQYYTGTQNGVLITEVSAIQRFVIERSQCICIEYTCAVHTRICSFSSGNLILRLPAAVSTAFTALIP